jgi:hypothetical protein
MKIVNNDFRYVKNGLEIITDTYADQPYLIKADDGAWVCSVTICTGREGEPGQHVVILRSFDQGKTWSTPMGVESPDSPENSYSVLLKVDKRIYCFYNHNTDNIRCAFGDPAFVLDGKFTRVDSLGYYVYKFSDDSGVTWSKERYTIPMRLTDVDRKNPYEGKIRFGWCVGRPFFHEGEAFVPFHKIGKFGYGGWAVSEGWLLKCVNIAEKDCTKHIWETLPDGEYGLKTPPGGGAVSEEHSFSVLCDGSFYVVYRTSDGKPVESYSRDSGHTWKQPQYKRYVDGRLFRHPRAANFCWKCQNGKYLYWYHNNGNAGYALASRNPVWISAGIEVDSFDGKIILWSQGEILLYEDDPVVGMSYPDLIEEDGRYFISETQKTTARIHEIPASFLETLWKQFDIKDICKDGLIGGNLEREYIIPGRFKMPRIPQFISSDSKDYNTLNCHRSFSLDLWIEFYKFEEGKTIFDSRDGNGAGIFIRTAEKGTVEVIIADITSRSSWTSDEGMFSVGLHHLGVIVDGGPKLILLVTDGILNDGAGKRAFGFGRYNASIRELNGFEWAKLGSESIEVKNVRVYSKALMITEMIGNYRCGIQL